MELSPLKTNGLYINNEYNDLSDSTVVEGPSEGPPAASNLLTDEPSEGIPTKPLKLKGIKTLSYDVHSPGVN
jgi:hypothetical protein